MNANSSQARFAVLALLMAAPVYIPACSAVEQGTSAVVEGNTAFAVDLYQRERTSAGNLFFSPYSISSAMGMTFAGARGETEKEMAQALHFDSDPANVHP